MPWEYTQLQLCRDVYHCTPSELAREEWATVQTHLALLAVEGSVRDFRSGTHSGSLSGGLARLKEHRDAKSKHDRGPDNGD